LLRIHTVLVTSAGSYFQELAGGTGGTAGAALELVLALLEEAPWPNWALLPVSGPALVNQLMTSYSHDP